MPHLFRGHATCLLLNEARYLLKCLAWRWFSKNSTAFSTQLTTNVHTKYTYMHDVKIADDLIRFTVQLARVYDPVLKCSFDLANCLMCRKFPSLFFFVSILFVFFLLNSRISVNITSRTQFHWLLITIF